MPKLIDADKINACLQKNSVNHILADIDAQPTVDAEPVRHGHWIPFGSMHRCSICEETVLVPTTLVGIPIYDYCPMCGAKMDVETGNTYSIGKIELPTGVFRQIYDEERREDETN